MPVATDRRLFLKYLGAGVTGAVAGASAGPLGPIVEARGAMPFAGATAAAAAGSFMSFGPIAPTDRDALTLPGGFRYQVVLAYGDRFTKAGERFGFNADFTAFVPRNADGTEGLLFVNHEYVGDATDNYGQAFARVVGGVPTLEDLTFDVGNSVVHLRKNPGGSWVVMDSDLNRRITANTLMIADGPALAGVANVGGTLGNCSGCHTPWNTVLTCEENYQDYVPENLVTDGRGTVGGPFDKNGTHFGWVVEIDPQDPASVPVKHTWLGRFRHENVSLRAAANEHVVAYMGDDRTNGHVYKFVSAGRYVPGSAANKGLLASGTLYSAKFGADGSGQWQELAPGTALDPYPRSSMPAVPSGATTLGGVYGSQANILIDAYRASNLIGSTPTGRPEDVEVHPVDKSIYIAFTANATAQNSLFNNIYGELVRIAESSADGTGTTFTWQRWKAGGPNDAAQAGHVFAAPDNLVFDSAANLWVVTDISTSRLNADARYSTFMNNGMFFVPTSGPHAGSAFQFASAPCESELTGPSWAREEQTLFLSVQHPGEVNGTRRSSADAPKGSNWPHRSHGVPLPAVVAIERD
ncbi:MAG: PhoX family phosphatase [Vicinamibacterales bacterium]